jgi:hypothetical protein
MLRLTKIVEAVIAPILLAAGSILFFFPSRTHQLWAWTFKPEMSAMTVGAGYLGGVWFFLRAFFDQRPYRVVGGIAAASPFTFMLLIATVLHWDKFNHTHISFIAWLTLYAVTPALLPVLAVANWRVPSSERDPPLPRPLRIVLALAGYGQVITALAWFVWPTLVIKRWPWALTPLAARTIASFMVFTGIMLGWAVFDRRSSALRLGLEAVIIGLVLTGVGALRAHSEFTGPHTWIVAWVTAIVGAIALAGASLGVIATRSRTI